MICDKKRETIWKYILVHGTRVLSLFFWDQPFRFTWTDAKNEKAFLDGHEKRNNFPQIIQLIIDTPPLSLFMYILPSLYLKYIFFLIKERMWGWGVPNVS